MSENKEWILKVEVLSNPQVAFPFPAPPEINVIAKVLDNGGYDGFNINQIVIVRLSETSRSIPSIGAEIEVIFARDFYIALSQEGYSPVSRLFAFS